MPELDIVIPLYKTEKNLSALIRRLNEWCATTALDVRVIFVDDGSPDRTFNVLRAELTGAKFRYLGLRLSINYGQHAATAVGLSYTQAPLVVTMDDDLEQDPFQIPLLMHSMETGNYDFVYGTFAEKTHSRFRNWGSRTLKKLVFEKNRDYRPSSSFRLMRSGVVNIFKEIKEPVSVVDEYLVHYSIKQGYCVLQHNMRVAGKSNYSNLALIRLGLEILFYHSSFPLRFITRLGLFISVVFFLAGLYYIWEKLVNDVQLGFTSIVVSIFFSTGMILFSLGVIGEYMRRIWISQRSLNRVIVAEELK